MPSPPGNTPLSPADAEAVEGFLAAIRAEAGAAENTIAAYRRDLEATARDLGGIALLDASPDALRKCLAVWRQGLAARTVARRLAALARFMRFCTEEGLRGDDPTAALDRPKLPATLPKSLTEHDLAAMFAAAEEATRDDDAGLPARAAAHRMVAMLEMLYATGMRITELVTLPTGAVRAGHPAITLTHHTKGGGERVVMMTAAAHAAVARWLEWRGRIPAFVASRYLFPGDDGTSHISRVRVWGEVSALARRAGVAKPVSPHMLRHSFATHMLNRGADLRALQLLLGHANITTTEIYTKTQDRRLAGLVRDAHPLGNGGND